MVETSGRAFDHFFVNRFSGAIHLRQPLDENSDDFEFRVRVSDDGQPSKSFVANVKGG